MNRKKADRATKGLYLNIMTSFYEISFGILKTFTSQKSTKFFAFFPSRLTKGLWSLRSFGVKTKRFYIVRLTERAGFEPTLPRINTASLGALVKTW